METRTQIVLENTPVETYYIGDVPILVKREDLCCPMPGPMFSKIRGVASHIAKRPEPLIGVLDTYHSKGGWAVSYVCDRIGKQCFDFFPFYKADYSKPLRFQQAMCRDLGADLTALKAGRSAILYHQAKKLLKERADMLGKEAYMMPNALKLKESVEETMTECLRTDTKYVRTMVISVSSATIASGVLRGLDGKGEYPHVYLHMGYSRSKEQILKYMRDYGDYPRDKITLVDEGYAYKDEAKHGIKAPFDCNPHYDLKAWQWLHRTLYDPSPRYIIEGPVMFWNIGA